MDKNNRKKTRQLNYNPAFQSVYRPTPSRVTVTLDDTEELDRNIRLILSNEDALYLASRLANQVGYRLVEVK